MFFGATPFSEVAFSEDPFHNAIVAVSGQQATITLGNVTVGAGTVVIPSAHY